MNRKKPGVDIINDILEAAVEAYPASEFLKSLHQQYHERGGLSKKQLEGLYHKASKVETIAPGKLATLEAVILKKPTKFKSTAPTSTPLYSKSEEAGEMIDRILAKYPQHKRALFLKNKYQNNEVLTATEISELKKFQKLLL
jgi:hypothetical protein